MRLRFFLRISSTQPHDTRIILWVFVLKNFGCVRVYQLEVPVTIFFKYLYSRSSVVSCTSVWFNQLPEASNDIEMDKSMSKISIASIVVDKNAYNGDIYEKQYF